MPLGVGGSSRITNEYAATSGIPLPNQLQAGRYMLEALDNDVLQQVAQARFDGALVTRLDLDEVRQRAHLVDLAVGAHQHHARGVGEARTVRVDFLERLQSPIH